MDKPQVFHPEKASRKGERNAWIITGFAVIGGLAISWRTSTFPRWMIVVIILLLLSAIFISLSHWVDRKTALYLKPDGVMFRNGLRNVQIPWNQVIKVSVIEDRWGQRVFVSGSANSLNFRLLSEIEIGGKPGGKMGFPQGEIILKEIIQSSGLRMIKNLDKDRYYARP